MINQRRSRRSAFTFQQSHAVFNSAQCPLRCNTWRTSSGSTARLPSNVGRPTVLLVSAFCALCACFAFFSFLSLTLSPSLCFLSFCFSLLANITVHPTL